jgi:hypothetical protein
MAYIGNPPANRFVAPKAASVFSGDGSTTAFTLDHAVGSDEDILVSVDGVIQEPSVAYAVSNGTTLTFTAAPSSNSGNNIFVYYLFRTVGTVSHPSNNALQASDITIDTTTLVTDSTNNRVGMGIVSPDGTLHVHSATAGSVTANTDADDLVVENSGHAGINILSPDANRSAIQFGHTSDNLKLQIRHDGGTSLSQIISDDTLTFNVGGGTERMRIDTNGHITKPTQPAFSVAPPSNQLNVSDSDVIVLSNEAFDQNGDFASNTFTAPVTGKYQLQVTGRVDQIDTDANWVRIEMVTSNREYQESIIDPDAFDRDPDHWSFHFALLADMDANDTVFLRWGQSGGSATADVDTQFRFSGYLVA